MADRPDAVRLPNATAAVIPAAKLADNLLSPTHRLGKAKAAYFARLGYDISTAGDFAEQLPVLSTSHEVVEKEVTTFGTKYTVEGWLPATDGGPPGTVRVVWIIPVGESSPRLVTAYPV